MITPYNEDLSIDWQCVDRLVDWYLQAGSSGLFAVCLSSEMFNLTQDERLALATRVVRQAAGRAPVIVSGSHAGTPRESAELAKRLADTGAAAIVCTASQFAEPEAGDTEWRLAVEKHLSLIPADIPLGIYECPQPYHRLLTAGQLGWLVSTRRFLCVKDTSSDMRTIAEKLSVTRATPQFRFYNANVATLVESLRGGAHGFSGIGANFCPEIFAWLCAHYDTRRAVADELQDFLNVIGQLMGYKYPTSAKLCMQMGGMGIKPLSRVSRPVFAQEDFLMFRSLRRRFHAWREKLKPTPAATH
jgi:4-hydroxy-tetrahydrodipicolinate synthase